VVAGKVSLDQVKTLAEKWFGPIPGGEKPLRKLPVEPVQTVDRRMEIVAQVPSNRIYKAYPVVGRYADGYHAVDMLADLMGRNESSFLYEKLVQNARVFDSISASQTGSTDPGLLIISGQVADGQSIDEAEKALDEAIAQFVSHEFLEEDLQRVKNQGEASLVFGEVEVLNRAMNLAMVANAGHVNYVNEEADKIEQVTMEEVNFWAKKIFVEGKSNTLLYKKN
jgi:predicted Zn-dependent peptidase